MAEAVTPAPDAGDASQGRWSEEDLQRAFAAAKQAGLSHYRVEIAPKGTLCIVVGEAAEQQ